MHLYVISIFIIIYNLIRGHCIDSYCSDWDDICECEEECSRKIPTLEEDEQ